MAVSATLRCAASCATTRSRFRYHAVRPITPISPDQYRGSADLRAAATGNTSTRRRHPLRHRVHLRPLLQLFAIQPAGGTFQVSPFGQIALGLAPTYPMVATRATTSPRSTAGASRSMSISPVAIMGAAPVDHRLPQLERPLQHGRRSFAVEHRLRTDRARLLVLQPGGSPEPRLGVEPQRRRSAAIITISGPTYFTYQDIRYAVIPLQFVYVLGHDPVNADSWAAFGTAIWHPIEDLT